LATAPPGIAIDVHVGRPDGESLRLAEVVQRPGLRADRLHDEQASISNNHHMIRQLIFFNTQIVWPGTRRRRVPSPGDCPVVSRRARARLIGLEIGWCDVLLAAAWRCLCIV
jgi:hypothetical protein